MRVLIFHPALLPPRDYGGTERVVMWLAKGLVETGHRVTVAALAGSQLPQGCELMPIEAGAAPVLKAPGTDVVHLMTPIPAHAWERLPAPALLTIHGNGQPGEVFAHNSVFLSADHARRHGAKVFVHNGIDPAEYEWLPREKRADFRLFLAKTNWRVKNLAGAMRLCAEARVPLRISGGARPLHLRARAALSRRMQWVGPVSGARKARLLAEAQSLVFPILWPEPFGLVVAEALMSGAPVIANRRGSLGELLDDSVARLLEPEDEAGWIDALRDGGRAFAPEVCRDYALKRFHYHRMTQDYISLYARVARGERLQFEQPIGRGWRRG